MTPAEQKDFREVLLALEPFARVAAISARFGYEYDKPMREILPGVWPVVGDCNKALELYRKAMKAGVRLDRNLA